MNTDPNLNPTGPQNASQYVTEFREGRQTVTVPTEIVFEVMDMLRLTPLYLDPPEDFKPHKWPTPEEWAVELHECKERLTHAVAKAWGVEAEVFPDEGT